MLVKFDLRLVLVFGLFRISWTLSDYGKDLGRLVFS